MGSAERGRFIEEKEFGVGTAAGAIGGVCSAG
jgi:hypothetical protein